MASFARLDERERLIAALIAMCLFAGVIALALHGPMQPRSAALEQGSLAAPLTGQQLHETAGAGAEPTDVPPGTGLHEGKAGIAGGDERSEPRGTTPPNGTTPPPREPPSDDNLISRLLSELPKLPPPPLVGLALLLKGLR